MVAHEQLVNSAITTVADELSSAATSMVVVNAGGFPAEGNFRICVETEVMLVTNVSGSTFTVVRGTDDTTAAVHHVDAQVFAVATADGLNRMISEQISTFAPERPPFKLMDSSGVTLTLTDFTQVNVNTTTAADGPGGCITLAQTANTLDNPGKILRSLTAPWTVTGAFRMSNLADATNVSHFGPCWRRSATSEYVVYGFRPFDPLDTNKLRCQLFNDDLAQTLLGNAHRVNHSIGAVHWFKVEDNTTNINVSYSVDGINFVQFYTKASATDLGAVPDQVGFYTNNLSDFAGTVQLLAWIEE
jgi:hypothetical protein